MGCCDRFRKWRSKGSTNKQTAASSPRPSKLTDKPVTPTPQKASILPQDSPRPQPTDNTEVTLCPEPNGISDPAQLREGALKGSHPDPYRDTSPDLWKLSFDKLSTKDQGRLNALLKTDQALSSDLTPSSHFTSQSFDELIPITSAKQKELSDKAWEFEIRGRSIKPAEYTSRIIDCLTAVGDVGVGFMPQPASIVWPLVKGFMKVPVYADAETTAVLMTADLLVRTITCGRGYESVYSKKVEKLGPELWKSLQSALMELYVAPLELLALASEQCTKGTVLRLVEAFLSPQKTQSQVSNVQDCHSNLRQVAQSCQTRIVGDMDSKMTQYLVKFSDLSEFMGKNFDQLFEQIEGRRRTEILDWISKDKPFDRHSTTTARRAPETCGWLLQSEDFKDWERTFAPAVLWLQGSPGTGKTFLTSSVIDHIYQDLKAEEGLAFYYCQRSGDKLEDPNDIIRSIFRQLATRALQTNSNQMRKDVQDLFTKSKDDMSHPEIATCKLQILKSTDQYSRITLVIDALDECAEPKKGLFDLIESMMSQSKCPMRVFLSARPNFGVEERFCGKTTIKTEPNQVGSDIRKLITHEIAEFPNWNLISEGVQLRAIDSLTLKSEGMFQWVSLHIEQLRTCEMDNDVLLLIEKMPKGLVATYQQIYDQISTHPSQKTIVDRAFLWLMYSNEPMDTDVILDAICYSADHNQPAKKIENASFLKLCKNLVVFDGPADRFRFCHASVSEYIAESLWTPGNAHCYAAKTCLRLLFLVYGEPTDPEWDSNRPGHDGNTANDDGRVTQGSAVSPKSRNFHLYCRDNWFHHVERHEAIAPNPSQIDPNLVSLLKSFLSSPFQSGQAYERWHGDLANNAKLEHRSFADEDSSYTDENISSTDEDIPFLVDGMISPEDFKASLNILKFGDTCNDSSLAKEGISPSTLPILAMCRFAIGTSLLVDKWSITEEVSSLVNDQGDTLLTLAVQGGSLQICEALVKWKVPIDHKGSVYGALHQAASLNRLEIARLLLKNGAAVDLKGRGPLDTPLTLAAKNGDLKMVQLLVKKGASIDYALPSDSRATALGISVSRGDLEIAEFLIDNGADVNFASLLPEHVRRSFFTRSTDGSVLGSAVWAGEFEAIQLLIKHGADTNLALQGEYGSALAIAARTGRQDIIESLIALGADVNLQVKGEYGSALAVAARFESVNIVNLLIRHGADVNMLLQNGDYGSALATAASTDSLGVLELLIKAGADVNLALKGTYGSALAIAACSARSDNVEILIKHGADVNRLLPNGDYGSALAAARGETVMKVLIDNGGIVDLLSEAGDYGSALTVAAGEGNLEMVDYLLNHGADVNLPLVTGIYGTALHAACYWGQVKTVERLLDAGAMVSLPQEHSGFKNAFEAAQAKVSLDEDPERPLKYADLIDSRGMESLQADKRAVSRLLIDHVGPSESLSLLQTRPERLVES